MTVRVDKALHKRLGKHAGEKKRSDSKQAYHDLAVVDAIRELGLNSDEMFNRIIDEIQSGREAEARKVLKFIDKFYE